MSTTITTTHHRYTTQDRRFTFAWPLPACPRPAIADPIGKTVRQLRLSTQCLLQGGYGVRCPITGEVLRIYRRALTTAHIGLLERLYVRSLRKRDAYLHLHQFTARSDGDLAKMRFWDLVEAKPAVEGELEPRGFWRLTSRARRWLNGADRIPRHVAVFRGECLGYWDEADLITPQDVEPTFSRDALFGVA